MVVVQSLGVEVVVSYLVNVYKSHHNINPDPMRTDYSTPPPGQICTFPSSKDTCLLAPKAKKVRGFF